MNLSNTEKDNFLCICIKCEGEGKLWMVNSCGFIRFLEKTIKCDQCNGIGGFVQQNNELENLENNLLVKKCSNCNSEFTQITSECPLEICPSCYI